jgi:crotonobetainyl-CoA:carnitine CoA-transferase CaiB-like acyl-CoA transferase
VEQLVNDPHVQARETITTVPDEDLGELKMQNLMFRLEDTPGAIRFPGRKLGQDTEQVYAELLGLNADRLAELREAGAV